MSNEQEHQQKPGEGAKPQGKPRDGGAPREGGKPKDGGKPREGGKPKKAPEPEGPFVGAPHSVAQIFFAPSPFAVITLRRLGEVPNIWYQALHAAWVDGAYG